MSTLKRYNGTSWETIGGSITGDTLPIGSEIDYTGSSVPAGWEEVADYSTSEVNTGKKWIDGRDIFRKVLIGTATTTNTTIDTSANVSSMNIIKIDGWIYKSATIQQQIGTYASDGNSSGIYVDNNGLKLLLPSAWVPCTYTAIIEYTKTTD